jgi:hypothetical protein
MMTESRLTFHEKIAATAWQKKVRDDVLLKEGLSGWWSAADLSLKKAVVRECDIETAKRIILKYEWLGTMVTGVRWSTGIFFDNWACGGVAVFGQSAGVNTRDMLGVKDKDIAYLGRGACSHWTPVGTASKLIGHTLRLAQRKGFKVALAYADSDAGEIGTVYQATNWLCIGRGAQTQQLVHPNTGRVYDQKITYEIKKRLKHKITWSTVHNELLKSGFKKQTTNPKWRYIYILAEGNEKNAIYERIQHLIVQYPKRVKDSSEPLASHAKEGGAVPTHTLQNIEGLYASS